MKQIAVCLSFLLASLTLAAQNQVQLQTRNVIDIGTLAGNGCPISMHASHGVWDHTVRVRQGQQEQIHKGFGQRILLSLTDTYPAAIVAAIVRLTGTTGKNHMLQAAAGNSEADGMKTVHVRFTADQNGTVSGDLYVPGLTSVSSVELLEVSYEDGRIWKIGVSSVCRVKPDPLMLVATH